MPFATIRSRYPPCLHPLQSYDQYPQRPVFSSMTGAQEVNRFYRALAGWVLTGPNQESLFLLKVAKSRESEAKMPRFNKYTADRGSQCRGAGLLVNDRLLRASQNLLDHSKIDRLFAGPFLVRVLLRRCSGSRFLPSLMVLPCVFQVASAAVASLIQPSFVLAKSCRRSGSRFH
jgi:hypothetical protein